MKILVIRMHRMGDILQLTPMLSGLKATYPQSRISVLVGSDLAELLQGNPHVDTIYSIPEKEYRYWLKKHPAKYASIFNKMYDLVAELRQKGFQVVVNRQYEVGAMIAHLVGAPRILGGSYSPEKGYFFEDRVAGDLFNTVREDRRLNRRNLVDWACRIAEIPPGRNYSMLFRPSESAQRDAQQLLNDNQGTFNPSTLVVQMGAAKSFRQWGRENFAHIVQWLIHVKGRRVVLVGSEDEKELGEYVERVVDRQEPGHISELINLIGKTSLSVLGALLAQCDCLITGDTGTLHIGAAVGTPMLALFFGTAYPWETGPYGPGHLVLYSDTPCAPCPDPDRCQEDHRCKRQLDTETVQKAFEAADAFWKNEPLRWTPERNSVHLFVTVPGADGEQRLLPAEDAGSADEVFFSNAGRRIAPEQPCEESLILKGDQIRGEFFKGDAQKGYALLAEYLSAWLDTKDVFLGGYPETEETLAGLVAECLRAVQDQDPVSLMDAIEYGFKPLVQQRPDHKQGLN